MNGEKPHFPPHNDYLAQHLTFSHIQKHMTHTSKSLMDQNGLFTICLSLVYYPPSSVCHSFRTPYQCADKEFDNSGQPTMCACPQHKVRCALWSEHQAHKHTRRPASTLQIAPKTLDSRRRDPFAYVPSATRRQRASVHLKINRFQ